MFLFTLAAALANYSTITEKYPSLREVLTTFEEESNEKLGRIDNEIDGIGHIPRGVPCHVDEHTANHVLIQKADKSYGHRETALAALHRELGISEAEVHDPAYDDSG